MKLYQYFYNTLIINIILLLYKPINTIYYTVYNTFVYKQIKMYCIYLNSTSV